MDSGNKVVCENTRAVILAKAVIHEVYFRKPICAEYRSIMDMIAIATKSLLD